MNHCNPARAARGRNLVHAGGDIAESFPSIRAFYTPIVDGCAPASATSA
jgi:hypothetical protein